MTCKRTTCVWNGRAYLVNRIERPMLLLWILCVNGSTYRYRLVPRSSIFGRLLLTLAEVAIKILVFALNSQTFARAERWRWVFPVSWDTAAVCNILYIFIWTLRLLQAIIVVLSAVSNGKLASEGLLLECIVRGAPVDNSHELGRTGWKFLYLLLLAFRNLRALCKCPDYGAAARCFSTGASRVRVVVLAWLFLLLILNQVLKQLIVLLMGHLLRL
jgi:hypothetical protein